MRFLEQLNPFYKAVSIIISSIILSFSYSITVNLCVFVLSLLLLLMGAKVPWKKVSKACIPVTLTAASLYMTGAIFSTGEVTEYVVKVAENMQITSSYNGLQLATRVFAFFGLGMLFVCSTNSLLFVESLMQQAKLPPKFAYGVQAALNLAPNIQREYENARFAMEARGVVHSRCSPKVIFAMFVNTILWADVMSMAMQSKGFTEDAKRIHYRSVPCSYRDWIFGMLPIVVLCMILYI